MSVDLFTSSNNPEQSSAANARDFTFVTDGGSSHVRVIEDKEGELWFVASDISSLFGYRMASDMTRILDADEKGTQLMRTPGGEQFKSVITEAGLYRVMTRSESSLAEPFQRWVTHEVLPSIRKHGVYATPATVEAMLSDPDTMIKVLTELKTERAKVAALEPKAAYVDKYVADEDLRLLRNVAKSLGVTESALRDALLEHNWIYAETSERWSNSQGMKVVVTRYSPYAAYAEYFRPVPNHEAPRFRGEVMHTLKVTPAGAVAIAKAVVRWGLPVSDVEAAAA